MTSHLLRSFRIRKRKKRSGPRPAVRLPLDARRLALGIVTVITLTFLMSIHFLPDRVTLTLGDRSPTEIRAPRSVTYTDTEATARLRETVAARVEKVYDFDPTALAQATHALSQLFDRVAYVREDRSLPSMDRKVERLSAEFGAVYTPAQLRYLLSAPTATLERLELNARRLVEDAMEKEIRNNTEDLKHAKAAYDENAQQIAGTKADFSILQAIGAQALRPTHIFNRRKTENRAELLRRSTPAVTGAIRMHDVIIRQGEVFTQLHLDKCAALGLVNPRITPVTGFSLFLLAAAMVSVVGVFIRRTRPAIYHNPRRLFLLAVLVISSVFGLKIFGNMLGLSLSGVQFGYLGMMTVVAAGMMIAVLLDASLAVLVTALLAVISGLIMNHEIRFPVMTLFSSLVGIYSVSNIRDRGHLLRAWIALSAANLALVWVVGGLLGDTLQEMITGSAWAALAATLAVPIFFFGVTVLEKPFGILTHIWLLELSASERPLLRKLCVTAPGTYAHSIAVGNLAEAAADAIGADSLFCRVASYYHDIGKMRRPHCFIENQRGENIHDRLNPSLSALIIASHVRDGLEMADEYRLPRQIKDIIAEHHGTSLIRYFYHLALVESGSMEPDRILEQHFRYEGPRPQTRESGIIMLADTVEAAARCLNKPTLARIQSLVESLIHEKLTDGQLDDCDLTLKDIQKIQAAFVRILSGMLHGRKDYPELPRAETTMANPARVPMLNLKAPDQEGPDADYYRQSAQAAHENDPLTASRTDDPAH